MSSQSEQPWGRRVHSCTSGWINREHQAWGVDPPTPVSTQVKFSSAQVPEAPRGPGSGLMKSGSLRPFLILLSLICIYLPGPPGNLGILKHQSAQLQHQRGAPHGSAPPGSGPLNVASHHHHELGEGQNIRLQGYAARHGWEQDGPSLQEAPGVGKDLGLPPTQNNQSIVCIFRLKEKENHPTM